MTKIRPFGSYIAAMRHKDEALYLNLCHLNPSDFWKAWKHVYPEDSPQGGQSSPTPVSIMSSKDGTYADHPEDWQNFDWDAAYPPRTEFFKRLMNAIR